MRADAATEELNGFLEQRCAACAYGLCAVCYDVATLAAFPALRALPAGARAALRLNPVINAVSAWIPFSSQGFGWVIPALAGFIIGLIVKAAQKRKATT